MINGEKTFITYGDVADFVMVFAVTDPEEKGADGGVTCFLVDREAGWKSTPIPTMGEWGPASPELPGRARAARGDPRRGGPGLRARDALDRQRPLPAPRRARSVPANGCVEMGMEHARQRVTFGEPIAEPPGHPVDARRLRRRDRGACAGWCCSAAWQVDQGVDSRQAQSMAKLYGGIKANEIVDRVLQMHGGMGYTRELPVERWYRELRVLRIYEGTDEIQRRTIARNLLSGHVSVRGHLG